MTDTVLQLRDLNYDIPLRIGIRTGFSGHILIGVFPEHLPILRLHSSTQMVTRS